MPPPAPGAPTRRRPEAPPEGFPLSPTGAGCEPAGGDEGLVDGQEDGHDLEGSAACGRFTLTVGVLALVGWRAFGSPVAPGASEMAAKLLKMFLWKKSPSVA